MQNWETPNKIQVNMPENLYFRKIEKFYKPACF